MTQRLILTGDDAHDRPLIEQAGAIIRSGGLVAFPTETVYGLGADAYNPVAVQRIFQAKGRPAWDPVIVHVASPSQILELTSSLPDLALPLIQRFMPGSLTLILPKSDRVSSIITAGRDTVGVRMPSHPVAQALLHASGVPIAAPSANRFGRPSPTNADHVLHDLAGTIEAVLDAGETPHGVESTIVDLTTEPPTLLRPGAVPLEAIEETIGTVRLLTEMLPGGMALPAPGTMARHYAPRVPLLLSAPSPEAFHGTVKDALAQHEWVGVMRPREWNLPSSEQLVVFEWGSWGEWDTLAQKLFYGLRWLEGQGVQAIVAPLPPAEGLARAVRDRLMRASNPE
ncbi:MAG: L-threonylcarbamoyladenylate synthase [Fimbriimonadales bacterium]